MLQYSLWFILLIEMHVIIATIIVLFKLVGVIYILGDKHVLMGLYIPNNHLLCSLVSDVMLI